MLKNKLMAIINLNEDHIYTKELTTNRPHATVTIAGRYRLIDFILSNITNAGISNVGVFAQRKTRSLHDHLGNGSSWDLDRLEDGLYIFSNQYEINEKQAKGDISTIFENIDYIERSRQEYIMVTTPSMIYNINFREVFKSHIDSGAEITTLYKTVDNADRSFYDSFVYNISSDGTLHAIGRNMCSKAVQNMSMECFIMKKDSFVNLVYESIENGEFLYIIDAINEKLLSQNTNLYKYNGYLSCIKDIRSYRKFNEDMLNEELSDEIFRNPNGLIYTKIKDEAPTYYSDDSHVENSIIASGCVIEGTVKNSIIFRRVNIAKGCTIENSILMQNSKVEENCYLNNVISDKNTKITHGKKLIGDINMPIIIKKGEII